MKFPVEAEIATRILLAAMQNSEFPCKDADAVANFYNVIFSQIVSSDIVQEKELGKFRGTDMNLP